MKWEYLVLTLPEMKPQADTLNSFGGEGWELVTVVVYEGQRVAYLKRLEVVIRSASSDLSLKEFEAGILQVMRESL